MSEVEEVGESEAGLEESACGRTAAAGAAVEAPASSHMLLLPICPSPLTQETVVLCRRRSPSSPLPMHETIGAGITRAAAWWQWVLTARHPSFLLSYYAFEHELL